MSADPALRLALLISLGVYALALAQLLGLAAMHVTERRRREAERRIRQKFGPVFIRAIEGVAQTPPALPRRHPDLVLMLWLFYAESTRGDSIDRLRAVGREMGFSTYATRLLRRRRLGSTLLAAATLGWLGDASAWGALDALASRGGTRVSLLALRAMSHIDPQRATERLFALLPERRDWPDARLQALLQELPARPAGAALLQALARCSEGEAPRLLHLVDVLRPPGTWSAIRPMLDHDQGVDTLASALRVVDDPRAVQVVRGLAAHSHWVVRAKAATALGRIGGSEDRGLLMEMLRDPVWWVRYRAGQSLIRLPGIDAATLEPVLDTLQDPYARDMLQQLLAEKALSG
ncbi:HEAT repeat domain-containing protein [Pseudomarimonas salicorniae]|uniref:HEAT repeat domain-containing protein n=1 Tax=Pseudomarimonas salicorniae TaxID=2933270 RepID=A0ABT0GCZ5_9GAMM|nr:HEAT repeat domain-containing protein [Lysobacter sp. CAU 1642]MCK7592303.1 HEAT repeat domain-containing protein [Lysobacter sp. CAU 1642]